MGKVLVFIFLVTASIPSSAIDFVDVRLLGVPELPAQIPGLSQGAPPGFAAISWLSTSELMYGRNPLYWILNVSDGNFESLESIENIVAARSGSFAAAIRTDAALLDYGGLLDGQLALIDGSQVRVTEIDLDLYHRLYYNPTFPPPRELYPDLLTDWSHNLLGGHQIRPRPAYPDQMVGLSLQPAGSEDMQPFPPGFVEFRGIPNSTMVAVSFDRFRIAVVTNVYRTAENEPQRYGWPLFAMRVVYDGTVEREQTAFTEPSSESDPVFRLTAGEPLRVTDANNYESRDSGEQDFWYHIESVHGDGWVYGGKLIIEGQTWEERLELRGPPLDIDLLLSRAEDGFLSYQMVAEILDPQTEEEAEKGAPQDPREPERGDPPAADEPVDAVRATGGQTAGSDGPHGSARPGAGVAQGGATLLSLPAIVIAALIVVVAAVVVARATKGARARRTHAEPENPAG